MIEAGERPYRPRYHLKKKVTNKVTENQREILININKNPNITSKELSVIVGISDRKVKENIKKIEGCRPLIKNRSGKGWLLGSRKSV
jgi:transcriptional antiterminator